MRIDEIVAPAAITAKAPADCTPEEIAAFCDLVNAGGEVQSAGLRSRVRRAHVLAFLRVDQAIVGVAAIKLPDENYRAGVFDKADVPDAAHYPFELGWLIVRPDYRGRGYSEQLIRAALAKTRGKVFATSAADNMAVHRINQHVGLRPAGQPFTAASGRSIVLFIKP